MTLGTSTWQCEGGLEARNGETPLRVKRTPTIYHRNVFVSNIPLCSSLTALTSGSTRLRNACGMHHSLIAQSGFMTREGHLAQPHTTAMYRPMGHDNCCTSILAPLFGLRAATLAFHHTYIDYVYLHSVRAMGHLLAFVPWQDNPRPTTASSATTIRGEAHFSLLLLISLDGKVPSCVFLVWGFIPLGLRAHLRNRISMSENG